MLWHFTCDHGVHGIGRRGVIRRGAYGVVWLTDDPKASRDDLGLTSTMLPCDRMEFRYSVRDHDAVRWLDSDVRAALPEKMRLDLEVGRRPSCWWVSREPVMGTLWQPTKAMKVLRRKGR